MMQLLLMYTLFAATFIAGQQAVIWCPPYTFIAIRMIIAGLLFISWLWLVRRTTIFFAPKDWLRFVILAAVHIAIAYSCEFWSLQKVPAAIVALFWNLSPFITAIMAYILQGSRATWLQVVGMIIGFAAVLPIVGGATAMQDLWCLTEETFGATVLVLISVISSCYGWILFNQLQNRGYSTMTLNAWAMLLGGLYLLPLLPIELATTSTAINALGTLAMLLFLILIGNVLAYNLYGKLLPVYGPTTLAFGGAIIPVITAGMQWLVFGQTVTQLFWLSIGGIIIAFAFFFHDTVSRFIGRQPDVKA